MNKEEAAENAVIHKKTKEKRLNVRVTADMDRALKQLASDPLYPRPVAEVVREALLEYINKRVFDHITRTRILSEIAWG